MVRRCRSMAAGRSGPGRALSTRHAGTQARARARAMRPAGPRLFCSALPSCSPPTSRPKHTPTSSRLAKANSLWRAAGAWSFPGQAAAQKPPSAHGELIAPLRDQEPRTRAGPRRHADSEAAERPYGIGAAPDDLPPPPAPSHFVPRTSNPSHRRRRRGTARRGSGGGVDGPGGEDSGARARPRMDARPPPKGAGPETERDVARRSSRALGRTGPGSLSCRAPVNRPARRRPPPGGPGGPGGPGHGEPRGGLQGCASTCPGCQGHSE